MPKSWLLENDNNSETSDRGQLIITRSSVKKNRSVSQSTRANKSQFWSLKPHRMTFLNYITFASLSLWNCEMFGQESGRPWRNHLTYRCRLLLPLLRIEKKKNGMLYLEREDGKGCFGCLPMPSLNSSSVCEIIPIQCGAIDIPITRSPRPSISHFRSLKICRSTFLNYIKLLDWQFFKTTKLWIIPPGH